MAVTDDLATSRPDTASHMNGIKEARWRITYKYTTMSISGTIDADPEFFYDEGEAMKRYVDLRHGDAEFPYQPERQYNRRDVKLWKLAGWQEVL